MKDTARAYHRLAPRYDRRWRRYLQATVERAAGLLADGGPRRVLDVGCGTGEAIRRLRSRLPEAEWVGVDPAPAMLSEARRKFCAEGAAPAVRDPSGHARIRLGVARAEALPLRAGAFDRVVCLNCLHCFRNAWAALSEMRRVLAPGGRLVLIDWCRDAWWCRLLDRWCRLFDPSHVKMFGARELEGMLQAAGFRAERLDRFRVEGPGPLRLWEMMRCRAVRR